MTIPPRTSKPSRMPGQASRTRETAAGSRKTYRLAIAIESLVGGGAEHSVLRLSQALIDRGHSIDILLFRPDFDYPDEIPAAARLILLPEIGRTTRPGDFETPDRFTGIFTPGRTLPQLLAWTARTKGLGPFRVPRNSTIRVLRLAASLEPYYASARPDFVIANLPPAIIPALLSRLLTPSAPPVLPVLRNDVSKERPKDIRRLQALLPYANPIVANSNGVAKGISQFLRVPKERLVAIYNPLPVDRIQSLCKSRPDHPWYHDGGTPIILGAGRFQPQKDFPTLLRAFARAHSVRPCRLIILGKIVPHQRDRYLRIAREFGVEEAVSFPGFVTNPYSFMRYSALFVLSSIHEGFANVVAEALACGCPCVSTDCPYGPSEILDNGRYGKLAPVGDHEALAKCILETLETPTDRQALVNRAIEFRSSRAAIAFEQVFDRVDGKPPEHEVGQL